MNGQEKFANLDAAILEALAVEPGTARNVSARTDVRYETGRLRAFDRKRETLVARRLTTLRAYGKTRFDAGTGYWRAIPSPVIPQA